MALILYAEDDELMGCVVRNILAGAGHQVGLLGDGLSLLSSLRVKRPSLVMLDCNMPGMPGVEVVRKIRNDRRTCDLPVTMVTARRGEADVALASYAGADGYIKKPFDPDYLIYMAETLIEGGRAARPTYA